MSDENDNTNEQPTNGEAHTESTSDKVNEAVSDAVEAVESATTPPEAPEMGEITSDDRTMAMLAHLLGIVTWFVGPLIIWLVKKDKSRFVDDQGKEAINFQITIGIAYIIAMIPTCITMGMLACLTILPWVASVVFSIIAGLAANKGEVYRYPVSIRLIK